jgi:hypothetical protein
MFVCFTDAALQRHPWLWTQAVSSLSPLDIHLAQCILNPSRASRGANCNRKRGEEENSAPLETTSSRCRSPRRRRTTLTKMRPRRAVVRKEDVSTGMDGVKCMAPAVTRGWDGRAFDVTTLRSPLSNFVPHFRDSWWHAIHQS